MPLHYVRDRIHHQKRAIAFITENGRSHSSPQTGDRETCRGNGIDKITTITDNIYIAVPRPHPIDRIHQCAGIAVLAGDRGYNKL